ncbi:hypothetical protein J5N97_030020 [Dioscorea zingiberensis]|uniref:Uncharacterized protein n=1 Tax=Dioscorea zingiberensis TaxID=325984 RepID=A0A9D5H3Q7_9LILI|nr:hypothetical protein J5N97_030020 [Dioscorea zingiberensis]
MKDDWRSVLTRGKNQISIEIKKHRALSLLPYLHLLLSLACAGHRPTAEPAPSARCPATLLRRSCAPPYSGPSRQPLAFLRPVLSHAPPEFFPLDRALPQRASAPETPPGLAARLPTAASLATTTTPLQPSCSAASSTGRRSDALLRRDSRLSSPASDAGELPASSFCPFTCRQPYFRRAEIPLSLLSRRRTIVHYSLWARPVLIEAESVVGLLSIMLLLRI